MRLLIRSVTLLMLCAKLAKPPHYGLTVVRDRFTDAGPMGGMDAALSALAPDETGTFCVAGDLPFYIEILNEDREVLRTMRAWMWVRSGDQRGCIGCHENRELAPENRATQALLRARPTTLRSAGLSAEKVRLKYSSTAIVRPSRTAVPRRTNSRPCSKTTFS